MTLVCEGKFYALHKLVLSACSEYFEQIIDQMKYKHHPFIVLKDIRYQELEALLDYMYVGEVNVPQQNLASLIKAAESLKIIGLAAPEEGVLDNEPEETQETTTWTKNDVDIGSNNLIPNAKRKASDDDNSKGTRYAKQGYGENVKKRKANNNDDFDKSDKKETLHIVKDAKDAENLDVKYEVIEEQVCF